MINAAINLRVRSEPRDITPTGPFPCARSRIGPECLPILAP